MAVSIAQRIVVVETQRASSLPASQHRMHSAAGFGSPTGDAACCISTADLRTKLKTAKVIIFLSMLLLLPALFAQDTGSAPPQAASIPGLGAIPFGLNGPGYIEIGGGYSDMYPRPYVPWRDAYVRILASGGRNTFSGEGSRQNRYGDTGYYYGAGITRDISDNWFADAHVGSSAGGFFLPKLRVDSSISRKLLSNKQLVLTGVFGYDKSKQVNYDYRFGPAFTYYTKWSVVGQGGVNFVRSNP